MLSAEQKLAHKRARKYQKSLQDYLELEWRRYPGYVKTFEDNTYDELIKKLCQCYSSMLYASKRIEYVAHIVDTIDYVYHSMTPELQKLADVRYWNGKEEITPWQETARSLGLSVQKAVRLNKAIMHKTADELGFTWDRSEWPGYR